MTDASLFRAESPQAMRRDRSFGTLEAMLKPMPSTVPCSPTPHFNGWDESPASSVPPSPRAARWNNRSLFTKYQSPLRPTTFAMASPMPMMALAEAARRAKAEEELKKMEHELRDTLASAKARKTGTGDVAATAVPS